MPVHGRQNYLPGGGEGIPGVKGKGSGPRTENQVIRTGTKSAGLRT